MKKFNKKKGGISIIGILFLGVILVLVLSYFKISIRSVVESPKGQDNIEYISGGGRNLWNDYFKKPVSYFWNDIFIDIFWKSFIDNMERIRDGKATNFENAAPTFNRK